MNCFIGVSIKYLQGYLDWFFYHKYLTYCVKILKQSQTIMNYSFSRDLYIKVLDIYSKEFPIDKYEVYADYNFTPLPEI